MQQVQMAVCSKRPGEGRLRNPEAVARARCLGEQTRFSPRTLQPATAGEGWSSIPPGVRSRWEPGVA